VGGEVEVEEYRVEGLSPEVAERLPYWVKELLRMLEEIGGASIPDKEDEDE
jgi:hypothetical protein